LRPNEKPGEKFIFVAKDEFEKMVAKKEFVEYRLR